jgi:hypothetical protein
MLMRTGLLATLIAITTFPVLPVAKTAAKEKTSPTNCTLSAEDYEVFSAVLSALGQPEDPEESWAGKDILLSDVTAQQEFKDKQWGGWGFHSKSKATPAKETQADAATKAEDHCQVEPKLQVPLSYQMISTEYLNKIFTKHGGSWDAFYKTYPKAAGFWNISRPGYNSTHDEAMLYVGHQCGSLCGTGHLYFLKKENGHWEVQSKQMLWIS